MPANVPAELEDKFRSCKEKVIAGGRSEESAYGICYAAIVEGKADALLDAEKAGFILTDADREQITRYWSAKYNLISSPVKAVDDWTLDVLAIPFDRPDADRQWFDRNTDIMESAFQTPLIAYQHGVEQGAKDIQKSPIIIGKALHGTLTKQSDGWHIKVILDKAKQLAKDIMAAAWKGLVAVSSGSIQHLARLDVGGKLMQYEKNRPGRIAVWPLAEISLWEKGGGNFQPASQFAVALPAMKALYRGAGLQFPNLDTSGAKPEALVAARRARIERARSRAKEILTNLKKEY